MAYEEHIDAYQADRNDPLPRDDDQVALTVFEAEKCAAIIDAYLGGLDLYRPAARAVEQLLRARAVANVGGSCTPSAEDAWQMIDGTPWPPPRRMWPQPDPTS